MKDQKEATGDTGAENFRMDLPQGAPVSSKPVGHADTETISDDTGGGEPAVAHTHAHTKETTREVRASCVAGFRGLAPQSGSRVVWTCVSECTSEANVIQGA